MTKNWLTKIGGVLFFSIVLSACNLGNRFAKTSETVSSPSPSPVAAEQPSQSAGAAKKQARYEFVATQSGQIALDLIRSQAQIETQDYGAAGQFVTSINGLAGSNEYYWAFYVNDAYAEAGASQTKLQKGDKIKFVYEAVTPIK